MEHIIHAANLVYTLYIPYIALNITGIYARHTYYSEDSSEAVSSLEFLKSVEKSNMKLPGVNNKDHKQVEKGRLLLTLVQQDSAKVLRHIYRSE